MLYKYIGVERYFIFLEANFIDNLGGGGGEPDLHLSCYSTVCQIILEFDKLNCRYFDGTMKETKQSYT